MWKEGRKMPCIVETYDVCVVGAGHAGCEAASRLTHWAERWE